MPTLIASIAALTVAFVGAVNAIWAIMRDRERLGALERVTALLSELDSGGYEWEMMRSMQKDLARQVFLTHLRRFMGGGWLRWGRTFAGTAIIPLVAGLPFRNVGSVGIISTSIGLALSLLALVFFGIANSINRRAGIEMDKRKEREAFSLTNGD